MPEPQPSHRLTIWIGALAFALGVAAWSWWEWWTFRYSTFDLAFYIQALSEALHGRWHVSLLDVPLMGNHAEPIVFLLLPIYAVWPHAMVPVLAQTLAVATMPFTAARIARHLGIGGRGAVLLALSTLAAPAAGWMALHEFHPETLAAPLILAVVEAWQRRRIAWYWCWWLLLLGCKENIALMLAWWGVVMALMERREGWRHALRWHLAPAALAFAWLAFYGGWLAPRLNGGRVDYLELYSHLGTTREAVLSTFFTKPGVVLDSLWRGLSKGALVGGILLPWLGLAFLRPHWLLIAAPIVLQHLLSWRASEWSIRLHYGAPLLALAWIAVAEAVARRERVLRWCWAVFVGSLVGQAVVGPVVLLPGEVVHFREHLEERRWKAEVMASVREKSDASVVTSNGFLPHLAARRELHSAHHILKGLKTLSRAAYTPPQGTDFVLIDYTDDTTFSAASGFYHPRMRTQDGRIVPSSEALLDAFLKSATYTARGTNGARLHAKVAAAPIAPAAPGGGAPLQVADAEIRAAADGHGAELAVRWQVPSARANFPWLALAATSGEFFELIPLGLGAAGAAGGAAEERWTIAWPSALAPGPHRLRLWVYPREYGASERGLPTARQIGNVQRIELGDFTIPPPTASKGNTGP